ncbi:MAG: Unknown protein [uncultured Sulfurovum sp.]|uniref:Lcl C-terminal domain-containing protein n=1 Tax=uncultured Sulfurovum sp. TaxID=269237 RepID=A0A6S6T212_9BACT|nr:MAG: Unknown protein [uncultured Sulfurovum sp.]
MNAKKYLTKIISFFIIGCLVFINGVQAKELGVQGIYRIKANKSKEEYSVSTGFLFEHENEKVIVTTLHGVIDSKSIEMTLNDGTKRIDRVDCLNIKKVNVDKDLALLEPCKDRDINSSVAVLSSVSNKFNYENVHLKGYPHGISIPLISKQINIHPQPTQKLKLLLPDDFRADIFERKKTIIAIPSLDTTVISIEGLIVGSHSGSPLLNSKNQVLGVASGSLDGAISWAIPFDSNIIWSNFKNVSEHDKALWKRSLSISKYSKAKSFGIVESSSGTIQWQKFKKAKYKTWQEAKEYVAQMNNRRLLGHNNWRLPKIGELKDLRRIIKNNPKEYSDVDLLYRSDEKHGLKTYVVNLGNAEMKWSDFNHERVVVKRRQNEAFAVRLVRDVIE